MTSCCAALRRYSGKLLHIDFGDCFEASMNREKFPERVPFRLTRMMVRAFEVSGIEGNFRWGGRAQGPGSQVQGGLASWDCTGWPTVSMHARKAEAGACPGGCAWSLLWQTRLHVPRPVHCPSVRAR